MTSVELADATGADSPERHRYGWQRLAATRTAELDIDPESPGEP